MSKEQLEQALRNWQDRLAHYENELSITASAPQRFELQKGIQECEQEIQRIKKRILILREQQTSPAEGKKTICIELFRIFKRKSFLMLSLIGVLITLGTYIFYPIFTDEKSVYTSKYGFSLQYPKNWISSGDQPIDDFNFIATEFTNITDPTVKISVEIQSLSQSQSLEDIKEVSLKEIQGDESKISTIIPTTLANLPAYKIDYALNDTTGVLNKIEIGTIYNDKAFKITYEADAKQYAKFQKSAEEIINSLMLYR